MDDLGYGDIGVNGALKYETPNINKLANQGMNYTMYYCPSAVSTASRGGMLTGCYPPRISFGGPGFPPSLKGINPDEVLIPEMLKTAGYHTGIIGKWHLGDSKYFLPLQHGFDEYFGLPYSNDWWPLDYIGDKVRPGRENFPNLPLYEGNEIVEEILTMDDQDQLTTKYTERAIKYIEDNKDQPFFLYLAHAMVHVPLGVSDKFRGKSEMGLFGDVMMEVDWSVGEVIKTLEINGLTENTLVIFTSDNGPWLCYGNHSGSTGGLREAKWTAFEGGQRVPCIMKWPGVIGEGSICNKLASSIDLFATFADITGAQMPSHKTDGVSLLPLMKGEKNADPREDFYYYYGGGLRAVQKGGWKLVFPQVTRSYEGYLPGKDGWEGDYGEITIEKMELYDLRLDQGERYDVSELHPDIVEELAAIGDKAREELGDAITKVTGKSIRPIGVLPEELQNN